ncbi:hypothetical protein HDU93_001858, partial [Gonapodya sp. JEL0774]
MRDRENCKLVREAMVLYQRGTYVVVLVPDVVALLVFDFEVVVLVLLLEVFRAVEL